MHSDAKLSTYASDVETAEPEEVIPLKNMRKVGVTARTINKREVNSCFTFSTDARQWTLATKGEDSAREWVMYLQQNLAGRKGSTFAF